MQSKSQIKSIGIDLGKTTFHVVALGARSQVVIRKKFSRSQLLEYTANLPSSLIGMEVGVGSHFLGRALREQGHEVRLIPAQFVRPFVKSNKNDYRDAEAIAEAVDRGTCVSCPLRRTGSCILLPVAQKQDKTTSLERNTVEEAKIFQYLRTRAWTGISSLKDPVTDLTLISQRGGEGVQAKTIRLTVRPVSPCTNTASANVLRLNLPFASPLRGSADGPLVPSLLLPPGRVLPPTASRTRYPVL